MTSTLLPRVTLPKRLAFGEFQLSLGEVEVEAAEQAWPKYRPLSLIAKTRAPIHVPLVSPDGTSGVIPLYFDLAGYKSMGRLSIDHEHDPLRVVGWGEPQLIDGPNLAISGQAVMLDDDCAAYEVSQFYDAGVPYQCSITWDSDAAAIEEVAAGQQASVNGDTITGPALIAREWPLLNVSVVLLGDDSATGAYFLSANKEGQTLTATTTTAAPVTDPAQPAETEATKPVETAETTKPETGETLIAPVAMEANIPSQLSAHDAGLALVTQFTTQFGAEHGLVYLKEKLSFGQALQRDNSRLQAQVVELQKQLSETNARLKSMPVGLKAADAPAFHSGEQGEKTTTPVTNRQRYINNVKFVGQN